MKNKIKVSPLVAGFFLIIMAIVLGSFLASQISEDSRAVKIKTTKEEVCGATVDYFIVEQENELYCFSYNNKTEKGELQIVFRNNGEPISSFHIRILTDSWIFEDDIKSGIAMHDSQLISYYYDYKGYGDLIQAKIWPVIEKGNERIICQDHAIKIDPKELVECPLEW